MSHIISKGVSRNILIESTFTIITDNKRGIGIVGIYYAIEVSVTIENPIQEIGVRNQAIAYASQIIQVPPSGKVLCSINQLASEVQAARCRIKRRICCLLYTSPSPRDS